ncbi:hypothetical protein B0H13DRAFT_1990602 [Mycena leptocephala]|nr:hypothetical protein B0H13DRAFT_1990602 [Mycena leptocephala]
MIFRAISLCMLTMAEIALRSTSFRQALNSARFLFNQFGWSRDPICSALWGGLSRGPENSLDVILVVGDNGFHRPVVP